MKSDQVKTAKTKIEPTPIEFDNTNFPSLIDLNRQTPKAIGISDLEFISEKLHYSLALKALFGNEYNPDNIGVYDPSSSSLYACSFVRLDKDVECDIAIVFGDYHDKNEAANVAKLYVDDSDPDQSMFRVLHSESNSLLDKLEIKLIFQKEPRRIDGKLEEDVSVPYLQVSNRVKVSAAQIDSDESGEKIYDVSYLVPFRFVNQSKMSTAEKQTFRKLISEKSLSSYWINGEIENIRSVLTTPYKGGSGWFILGSLSNSYNAASIEMPLLELSIIGYSSPIDGDFGTEFDVYIDPDYMPSSVVSKPNKKGEIYTTINPTAIRMRVTVSRNCPVKLLLGYHLQGEATKASKIEAGLMLRILGMNKTDPTRVPSFSIVPGKPKKVPVFPDFAAILGVKDNQESTDLALEASQTVTVTAQEVKERLSAEMLPSAF